MSHLALNPTATSVSERAAKYHEQGFHIAEDVFDAQAIRRLRDDALHICRGGYGSYNGWLGPHDDLTDDEVMHRYLCIHFPHKVSQVMLDAVKHPDVADVLIDVIGPDVKCMQSMLFIKAAGKPGQAWHQDECYIPTRDRSLTGAWIAMDDATVENGCLWVIPGSHQPGILWEMAEHNDDRFDCANESRGFPYTDDDAIPVEVKAGSVVFFNGYLLHRSLPNRKTSGYRRALVNHYMSAQSLLPWNSSEHWQAKHVALGDFRDIVMVAGNDPHAWKGISDIHRPHVRPSGEGGCAK